MGPARLAVRAGVERSVPDDGCRVMARVAHWRIRKCQISADSLPDTACSKHPLVVAVFRLAIRPLGVYWNTSALGADRCDIDKLFQAKSPGSLTAGALSALGKLCLRAGLEFLADEPRLAGLGFF